MTNDVYHQHEYRLRNSGSKKQHMDKTKEGNTLARGGRRMSTRDSDHLPTITQDSVGAMTCSELVDFLVAETSEAAVSIFVGVISVFGIYNKEDAVAAMEKDADARKWAEATALLIPEPYEQNVKYQSPETQNT